MNQVQYIGLQPLMKASIFNFLGSNLLPSTNLAFCAAPTSKALTLSSQGTDLVFRGSNPREPTLLWYKL